VRAGDGVLFGGVGLSRGAGLPDRGESIAHLAGDLGLTPHPRRDSSTWPGGIASGSGPRGGPG
jgi:hypothetical protein